MYHTPEVTITFLFEMVSGLDIGKVGSYNSIERKLICEGLDGAETKIHCTTHGNAPKGSGDLP